jgi:hypothetical protein
MKMNKVSTIAWGFGIAVLITGCAAQSKTREQALQQPVNCDTAEGDIRVLQSEKNTTAARVATGQYNRMIDEKIEEIKKTRGM